MPAPKPTMVYPVRGTILVGTPNVAHEVPTLREAEELVATGAYALTQAEADDLSVWQKPEESAEPDVPADEKSEDVPDVPEDTDVAEDGEEESE